MSTTLTFEVPTNKVAEIQALVQTYLTFNSKSTKKPKKKLSIHDPRNPYYAKLTPEEEKGVGESLKDYAEGRFIRISSKEELTNHLQNLKKQANV